MYLLLEIFSNILQYYENIMKYYENNFKGFRYHHMHIEKVKDNRFREAIEENGKKTILLLNLLIFHRVLNLSLQLIDHGKIF